MHSPTYDELVSKISVKSDKIATITNSMKYTLSKWENMPKMLYLIHTSKGILRLLNKIEKKDGVNCNDSNCPIIKDLTIKLPHVLSSMQIMLKTSQEFYYPNFIINLQQDLINDFEDKLENYMLASDSEIKGLAMDIANRINQRHGIQSHPSS